ncbi:hypothetical protein E2562_020688 [Oryza meyeriana var. granulata]|uniref:Elongation factor Ts, mitochondrial n=1 Tax=Oryza meyeriana var. granulata TaxID=110450 RepID=A0A6G1EMZ8_9ORYZ|nr:hypothetical protein E2562_020688 [Oryza meyeriana var. granulata]
MNLIKKLQERMSALIKDVKVFLVSCNWDIDAPQKDLRKRGVVLAAKKSSRTATEGLLAIARDEETAVVVELNCEIDFVTRNDVFQYLASSLAKLALSARDPSELVFPFGPEYLENLSVNLDHPKLSGETTVQSVVTEVAAMVGENVKFRRGFMLSTTAHGVVSSYLHSCPQPELVSAAALENEQEILRTQAESSGKSQMAMEKMVEGRLRKYFEEVVLLEQKYVVNDSTNIKSVLNDLSKEVGSKETELPEKLASVESTLEALHASYESEFKSTSKENDATSQSTNTSLGTASSQFSAASQFHEYMKSKNAATPPKSDLRRHAA